MTTGTVRCPFCDGALVPGRDRCTYCGNTVDLGGESVPLPPRSGNASPEAATSGPPRVWLSMAIAISLFVAGVAFWYLLAEEPIDSPPSARSARGTRPPLPVGALAPGPDIPPPPARVILKVRSIPSNAVAFLDGELLGRTPVEVSYAPNAVHRKLALRSEGYLSATAVFVLDESREVVLTLERDVAAPDEEGIVQGLPGRLSRETVSQVLDASRPAVQRCYERGLLENPQLSGRVTVSMIIQPTGRLSEAWISSSTLDEAVVEGCIENVLRRLRFPPFDGSATTIRYPFVFRSSGD